MASARRRHGPALFRRHAVNRHGQKAGLISMKWLLTSVAATLMFCAPAAADGLTGRALAEGCQENSLERVACLAYMEGYAHGFVSNDRIMTAFLRDNVQSGHLEVSAPAKRVDKPAYCADDEMPGEAIRAAYLGWAAGHPDELDQPAASALFLALAEAFPCSGPPLADASYQSASWQP